MNKNEPKEQNGAEAVSSSDVVGHAWLVVGECGEYSAARKWNVRGYRTEAEAVAHAEAAQAVADSIKRKYEKNWWDAEGEENPHDPQYASDYTGTSYRVEMVVLGAWTAADDERQPPRPVRPIGGRP